MKSFKQLIKEAKPVNVAQFSSSQSNVSISTSADPVFQIGKGANSYSKVAVRGTGLGLDTFDGWERKSLDKFLKKQPDGQNLWHAVNKLASKIHYDNLMKKAKEMSTDINFELPGLSPMDAYREAAMQFTKYQQETMEMLADRGELAKLRSWDPDGEYTKELERKNAAYEQEWGKWENIFANRQGEEHETAEAGGPGPPTNPGGGSRFDPSTRNYGDKPPPVAKDTHPPHKKPPGGTLNREIARNLEPRRTWVPRNPGGKVTTGVLKILGKIVIPIGIVVDTIFIVDDIIDLINYPVVDVPGGDGWGGTDWGDGSGASDRVDTLTPGAIPIGLDGPITDDDDDQGDDGTGGGEGGPPDEPGDPEGATWDPAEIDTDNYLKNEVSNTLAKEILIAFGKAKPTDSIKHIQQLIKNNPELGKLKFKNLSKKQQYKLIKDVTKQIENHKLFGSENFKLPKKPFKSFSKFNEPSVKELNSEKKGVFGNKTKDKVARKLFRNAIGLKPNYGTPESVITKDSEVYKKLIKNLKKYGADLENNDGEYETAEAGGPWSSKPIDWGNVDPNAGRQYKVPSNGIGWDAIDPNGDIVPDGPSWDIDPNDVRPDPPGRGPGAVAGGVAGGMVIVVVIGGIAIYYAWTVANDPTAPENQPSWDTQGYGYNPQGTHGAIPIGMPGGPPPAVRPPKK